MDSYNPNLRSLRTHVRRLPHRGPACGSVADGNVCQRSHRRATRGLSRGSQHLGFSLDSVSTSSGLEPVCRKRLVWSCSVSAGCVQRCSVLVEERSDLRGEHSWLKNWLI